jgi:hypothetical protein
LNIIYNKPPGLTEEMIFEDFPPNFSYRRPSLRKIIPMQTECCGMYIFTQNGIFNLTQENIFKKSVSLNKPLKRVYEIETENSFTGLEEEGIALMRGKIKEVLKEVKFVN